MKTYDKLEGLKFFNRTLEQLEKEIEDAEKESKYTCSMCGFKHEPAYNISPLKGIDPDNWANCRMKDIMIEKKTCFECAIWLDIIESDKKNSDKILICKGNHFIAHGWLRKEDMNGFIGFGGDPFYFRMKDGSLYRSNNVWHQGEIPNHFKEILPDNCEMISKEEYEKALV